VVGRALYPHREIGLVLIAFIGLGLLYSAITPLFEAPDEQWHFAFVQHVASGRGLPIQATGQPEHLARQEGSQPPLYYLLAAAATFWIDTSDFPGIVWENPHYGYDVPGVVNDNKNLFIHTQAETFPYRGAVLAIHIARGLSVLIGALGVLFTYLLTLEILPGRQFLAAGAAALVAFIPQFLFVSGAVSNDSSIVAMAALALWMMLRMLRRPFSLSRVIWLGVATGLAALAKVSGLGLVFIAALVLAYGHRNDYRRLAVSLGVFCATVLTVAGWWYLRNWLLYGEVTGTEMMVRIFGARAAPLTGAQWLAQLSEVWETFWIGFGWGNIRAAPWVYAFLRVLVVLSSLGLVVGLVRRRAQLRVTLVKAVPLIVLAAWIGFAFVELVHWMDITQAPHGRLFFPVLPALAPLLVYGLAQWAPRIVEPFAARTWAVSLFALGLASPFVVLRPAYAFPRLLYESQVPATAHRVDVTYGAQVKLLAYEVSPNHALPGESISLTLYWQGLAQMDADYSVGIHLQNSQRQVIGERNSYPGHGMLPTRLWRVGQIVQDTYWVPVAAEAPTSGVVQIQVALYTREDRQDLPAKDPAGQVITPIIGRFRIGTNQTHKPQPQHPESYRFGKEIALIGYDQTDSLTLYWKRLESIAADYTVFVHVLDSDGKIVAQQDRQPAGGDSPTSLWADGEVIPDTYPLRLNSLAPGTYRIEVGLYRPETDARLAVSDESGKEFGDHVELGPLRIGP
jgi:hypothetical protein